MLSRVADAIYWMSRSVERAENVARFVDVTLGMMLDLPQGSAGPWEPLVSITGDEEWFRQRYGPATRENVIRFLTFDPEYPHSILSCLRQARENARSVREIISSEMWEQLTDFAQLVERAAAEGDRLAAAPSEFYRQVKLASHLFGGITGATMSHNEGWHFANLGRLLERADKTSRILDVKYYVLLPRVEDVGTPIDDVQWSAVLRSVSAFEMYRKRHHGITPARVVEFLILDRQFPRAVHFCVLEGDESLHAISGTPRGTFQNTAEQHLGRLQSELAYTTAPDIIRLGLHEFIDGLQTKLNAVGEGIFETFMAIHPPAPATGEPVR